MTKQKQTTGSEREMRMMARFPALNPDPVLTLDMKGKIVMANPAAHALFQIPSLEGRSWFEICGDFSREAQDEVALKGVPLEREQVIGKNIFCFVYRRSTDKAFLHVYGRDVTEKGKINQKLRETEKQLIQAAKMVTVGELASGVAHELNNPLQAILGGLEMIQILFKETGEKEIKKDIQSILNNMKRATERSVEVVQGLLRFAKPSVSFKGEVNLVEVLEEAYALANIQVHLGKITVEKKFPDTKILIKGNARELVYLFLHLITNAVRAMEGVPERKLILSIISQKGGWVVSIKDTGHGIPRHILPRIFEPFFTTSYEDTNGRMVGTGLGLPICQRIAEGHQGHIDVESKPGKGANFLVTFPL